MLDLANIINVPTYLKYTLNNNILNNQVANWQYYESNNQVTLQICKQFCTVLRVIRVKKGYFSHVWPCGSLPSHSEHNAPYPWYPFDWSPHSASAPSSSPYPTDPQEQNDMIYILY